MKKKKMGIVIIIILVLVILLFPIRMNLKDGGSVSYKSLLYEVTKIHQLSPDVDGVKPYIDGLEIKILGMRIYRETNETENLKETSDIKNETENLKEASDIKNEPTDKTSDEWGLSMDIVFNTATRFDIVFTHSSAEATVNGTMTTSPEYEIRVIYNDEVISFHDYMTNVLDKTYVDATPTWDTVLYTIPIDETFKIETVLNVGDENGGLPLGEYVLCKLVTLTTDDGEKIKKVFTKEFTVTEGIDTAGKNTKDTGITIIQLSESDNNVIKDIIANGKWANDVTKTISDYMINIENRTVYYNSTTGVFNEGEGSPFPVKGKSLRLTEIERQNVNDFITNYINN